MPRLSVGAARVVALLVLGPLACATLRGGAARAEQGEWQLGAGPAYRGLALSDEDRFVHAPGAEIGLWHGLDDFWQVGGALEAGFGLPAPSDDVIGPAPVAALSLEARYRIDIVTWIPYGSVALGALWHGFADTFADGLELVVALGGGVDYRPARDWSLALDLRYDLVLTDLAGLSPAFHVALHYSVHFE